MRPRYDQEGIMSIVSVSTSSSPLEQQPLQQVRATQGPGQTPGGDSLAAKSNVVAIQYVEPPPPPPPRLGPAPARLPSILETTTPAVENNVSTNSLESAVNQQLNGVRSFLLVLEPDTVNPTIAPQSVAHTGGVPPPKTLLTI
jgi:hypothetical protein